MRVHEYRIGCVYMEGPSQPRKDYHCLSVVNIKSFALVIIVNTILINSQLYRAEMRRHQLKNKRNIG